MSVNLGSHENRHRQQAAGRGGGNLTCYGRAFKDAGSDDYITAKRGAAWEQRTAEVVVALHDYTKRGTSGRARLHTH